MLCMDFVSNYYLLAIINVDIILTQPYTCICCMCLDQHVLLGADEGIYTLNLNEIHEGTMELVR